MTELIIILFSTLLISFLIGLFTFNLDLLFLGFKIEKHPYLKKLLEDKLNNKVKEYNLKVFVIPFEELNEGTNNVNELALGKYIWTTDEELLESANEILSKVSDFENHYGPINEHRTKEGLDLLIKRKYFYPRIELADQSEKRSFDKLYFYKTFAHEIGHHVAITKNNDNTEKGADDVARDIIRELPNYFQCIFWYLFDLNPKKKLLYKWQFFTQYYFKRKKLTGF